MKSLVICILWLVSAIVPFHCQALISIDFVSPEQAKELGVSFKIHKNGEAGYAVTMDFEEKGALKNITYVRLQIGEGKERVMSSQLRVTHPEPGKNSTRFSAFPAYLKDSYFFIIVYNGSRGGVGYRFKVSDFVELPKVQ